MGLMLFDTTFFVDLDREQRRDGKGPAHGVLRDNPEAEMAMSVITRGELARGFNERPQWVKFCRGFLILPINDDILWIAAESFTTLKKAGLPISDNDLWIGATAIHHNLPLVTDNVRHLQRLPGLKVVAYKD